MSSIKSRKSRHELIRSAVGIYLKQRNYSIASDRFRKSELILTQTAQQLMMSASIKNEISRTNSFLFSNVFCLNNNPAQVDQQFSKLHAFIEAQRVPAVKEELGRLLPPLLCHLYIEMLKGRDWRPALELLRKYAHIVGPLDATAGGGGGGSAGGQSTKINGTVEEATPNHSPICFAPHPADDSNEAYKQMIYKLSTITRLPEIEQDAQIAAFRSCKCEVAISDRAQAALEKYLGRHSHVLILQMLQIWFHFDTLGDGPSESESEGELVVNGTESPPEQKFSVKLEDRSTALKMEVEEPQEEAKAVVRTRLQRLEEAARKVNAYVTPYRVFNVINASQGLCTANVDPLGCHMAAGFEDSSIVLWSSSKSTFYGRKPFATARSRQCEWSIQNCDRQDEEEESDSSDEEARSRVAASFRRRLTSEEQRQQFMTRKCQQNSFSDSGGFTLRGHSSAVTDLLFSAHTPLLISVSRDLTMRAWKGRDYSCAAVYRGHNYPIWCVAESATGLYLATGSRDSTARLWSTDREFPLQIYVGHTQDVTTIAFHPNGNYLATGSSDLTVRLWDVTSGKLLRVFTDCKQPISTIAFSPNGQLLAAAGEENRVRIFDLAGGSQLAELKDHTATVTSIAWSRAGDRFASSCASGVVRMWDVGQFTEAPAAAAMTPSSSSGSATSAAGVAASANQPSTSSLKPLSQYSTACRRLVRVVFSEADAVNSLCCIGND